MSFSYDVKKEILQSISENIKNKKIDENVIDAERFGENITEVSNYEDVEEKYIHFFDISLLDELEIKYILKGLYLASGCIVDPNSDYHFEIVVKSSKIANYISNILSILESTPRVIKRKYKNTNRYVIYIKDAEQISTFLSLIDAYKSKLEFENIRVEKNVKNSINRAVNCETANLYKTINTALKQIHSIEMLKENGIYNSLDEKLKLTADMRQKYNQDSLEALATKMKISKAGLKHRLDKLIELANEIKDGEEHEK